MPSLQWNRHWAADLERFRQDRPSALDYGAQWGDPDITGLKYWLQQLRLGGRVPGDLARVVTAYIRPYVHERATVLEIGAGGGRWTKYLLAAEHIIAVDLNPEFFPLLQERFRDCAAKLEFYHTRGYELAGVAGGSVDFVFSFGTFVHIEPEGIDAYLGEIERVLRPGAAAAILYADKTKRRGRKIATFSNMNAALMAELVAKHEFDWIAHDTRLLNHSNIAVLRRAGGGG